MGTPLKLSVLVICYNQENTITQTIESIVTQEHNYSYELLICDDCSTDSTPLIIGKYYEKYPDIIKPVLRKKNLGLIGNYYDGISQLTGEYIMVCAGDDYWLPGKVQKQIEYLDTHPDVGMIYGDAKFVDENGLFLCIKKGKIRNDYISLLKEGNHIVAPTMALRHILLRQYISDVVPNMKNWTMEDYPMILWFSIRSLIAYCPGEVVAYRVLEESASHSMSLGKILKIEKSGFDVQCYFIKNYGIKGINIEKRYINKLLTYLPCNDSCFIESCQNCITEFSLSNLSKTNFSLRIKYSLINKFWRCYMRIKEIIANRMK